MRQKCQCGSSPWSPFAVPHLFTSAHHTHLGSIDPEIRLPLCFNIAPPLRLDQNRLNTLIRSPHFNLLRLHLFPRSSTDLSKRSIVQTLLRTILATKFNCWHPVANFRRHFKACERDSKTLRTTTTSLKCQKWITLMNACFLVQVEYARTVDPEITLYDPSTSNFFLTLYNC